MDLVALNDFNAVARHGGFGPASRATGCPKATLSRRVRALEAELGVRLIERGSRALRLTEEGRALDRRTAGLIGELAEIGEEVAGSSGAPRGRLRISVPAMHAGPLLGGVAARFVAAHPGVQVEIVAEDRAVDPVAEGYDIVVRANPAPDSGLVGQSTYHDVYIVAAWPGLPCPAAEAAAAPVPAVLQRRAPDGEIWRIERPGGPLALRPEARIRVSSLALVRGAVLAGAGAGLFPSRYVAEDIASGALVAWGEVPDRRVEVWVLHASRRLVSAKVRLFVEALRDAYAT